MLFKIRLLHDDNDWFTTNFISRYTTRLTRQNTLFVLFIRSEYSRQNIDYIGPVQWNGLPTSFRTLDDFVEFKTKLKKYWLTL